jgi:hypothetical protein
MNIKECMRNYLEENKIDGLYNEQYDCSCAASGRRDFMRCSGQRGLKCLTANEKLVSVTKMLPVEICK